MTGGCDLDCLDSLFTVNLLNRPLYSWSSLGQVGHAY